MRVRELNKKTPRQNAKGKGAGKRWLIKISISAAVFAVLSFALWYAASAIRPVVFPVNEIVFTGNKHLSDTELRAIMNIQGSRGMLELSNRDLAQGLLKSPWIRTVSFRKDFPNRFLVKIEETVPCAILEINARRFLIDDRGNLLQELKNDTASFLPIVSGNASKNRQIFSEVLKLVKAMRDRGFVSMKDRIEIIIPSNARQEDIAMLVDGTLVKVGSGEYEEKLQRLIELEDEILKRGIPVDYIDLRFAKRVVVKPFNEVIQ